MRVTWKVAYRDGVSYPVRSEPMESSKDDDASKSFYADIVTAYDEYIKRLSAASDISERRSRGVERAMRFDSWCYVRYEALPSFLADGTYAIVSKVSVDNPNRCVGEAYDAAVRMANDIAHIVVAKRNMLESEEMRRRIIFDETSPYFKYGVRADEMYIADKAKEERAAAEAKIDALHAATRSACPHMSDDGHCLIHTKGCPYFDNGFCDLGSGFQK